MYLSLHICCVKLYISSKVNCLLFKLYRSKQRKMFLSPRRESNPQPSDLSLLSYKDSDGREKATMCTGSQFSEFAIKLEQQTVYFNLPSCNNCSTLAHVNSSVFSRWQMLKICLTVSLFFQVHLPASLMGSGILPIYSSICHNIELVLQVCCFNVTYKKNYTVSNL